MALSIDSEQVKLVTDSENELVLGIITREDIVKLKLSDRLVFLGHVEWISMEPMAGVTRGFSLLVRNGKIGAIFPRSRLNPGPDARLENEYIEQLLRLLPTDENVRTLE